MRLELSLAKEGPTRHVGLPSVQGLKLGLFFIPARHIGGDFIDFVCFNGTDESGVVFADITATVFQPLCSRMFKVFIDDVLHSKLAVVLLPLRSGLRLNVF